MCVNFHHTDYMYCTCRIIVDFSFILIYHKLLTIIIRLIVVACFQPQTSGTGQCV